LFGTKEVAAYYQKTDQTIRAWAEEFGEHLSPMANPGKGKGRSFSVDDLAVFALVAEMKERNATYEDIQASLRSGNRGEPPNLSEKDLKLLSATEGEKRAALEIQVLQQHIIDIQQRLNRAEEKAAKVDELNQQNASLKTEVRLLREQLESAKLNQSNVMNLSREIGEAKGAAYIEGYKAALKDQEKKDPSE
jgi:DNA-binding transcriptional MerR regulator